MINSLCCAMSYKKSSVEGKNRTVYGIFTSHQHSCVSSSSYRYITSIPSVLMNVLPDSMIIFSREVALIIMSANLSNAFITLLAQKNNALDFLGTISWIPKEASPFLGDVPITTGVFLMVYASSYALSRFAASPIERSSLAFMATSSFLSEES
jgi:hypothetical protein